MTIEELIRDLGKDERVMLIDLISTLKCTVGYLNTYEFFKKAEVKRFAIDADGLMTIVVKDIIRCEGDEMW